MSSDQQNNKELEILEKDEKSYSLPFLDFIKINLITFILPFYICLFLFLVFEFYFIQSFSIPLFIHFLILPAFFLFLYYLYLVVLIEICRIWVNYWNRRSPPKEGVFKRELDDLNSEDGRLIKYYHKRGFIIKYPVWITSKSPFPWLVKRALRRIGHNKIGKKVIYEDCYYGLEFTDIQDEVFIYPTTAISSHAVNTVFGKISMFEIKLAKNTTLFPGIITGPGVETGENYVVYPNTVLHKNWRGIPEKFHYQGSPGKPVKSPKLERI